MGRWRPSNERALGTWNRYRIRADRGEWTLEVNGVVQNVARWREGGEGKIGLQSEGATIEPTEIVPRPSVN